MNISELGTSEEKARFNNLALTYGTIFNTTGWAALFGDRTKCYGIYNRGKEVIGGFSAYQEKRLGLSIYRNPPYTPAIGPFMEVTAENPVSVMDTVKEVLTSVAGFMESQPYAVISCSLNCGIRDVQPFIWKKFKVTPYFTYIIDLANTVDILWKKMSGERRKNVSKGIKDGLMTRSIDDLGVIKTLVMKSFKRQGKRPYERYLDRIFFDFATKDNSFAFATFAGDVPIASVFCVYDRNSAYYLAGGFDSERKHHGAGAMAMWEAIKFAKNLGLRFFDFEGSMSPQIEKYFRGFGGSLTPYYQINKAKLPLEVILKFYKREFF